MRSRISKVLAIGLLAITFGCTQAAPYAQNHQDIDEEYLIEKLSDPNRKITPNIYGYSPEQYEVVKRHEKELLTNKSLARYLVRQMRQLGYLNEELINNPETLEKGTKLTGILIKNLINKGLLRLPYEEQYDILELWMIAVDRVSDEDCVCFFEGAPTVDMQRKMASSLMLSFYPDELERYLEICRKAVFAEVADAPVVRKLSLAEYKFAEETLQNLVQKKLNKIDSRTRNFLVSSVTPNASKAAKCAMWKFTYDCALTAEGQTGEWLMHALISDIQ